MNLRNKPALAERLAAEYALGTLRGAARARFEHWVAEDGAIARSVDEWQARLGPLAAAVAARPPHERVWRAIERRVAPTEPLRREAWWRVLALLASGAAAALVVMAVLFPAQHAQPPAGAYVAVLSDARSQKAVLFVNAGRHSNELRLRPLDPGIQVSNASLELWALPRGGKPRSLGLVPAGGGVLRLAAAAEQVLRDVPMLAVSLEPVGGSKTGAPTGPVLYSGPCVKDW